jgi:phospholipase C
MYDAPPDAFGPQTRRAFLRRVGAAGVSVLGGSLGLTASAAGKRKPKKRKAPSKPKPKPPIQHLVISVQENHSFDHYFGYASQVQAAGYGPPAGFSQPDAAGTAHAPFEQTQLSSSDPPHFWPAVHAQLDGGKMDGFYQAAQAAIGDGSVALGYYTAKELPFY